MQRDTWLEIELINSFLHCFSSEKFFVLDNNYWDIMVQRKSPDKKLLDMKWNKIMDIIVPRYEKNHFVLIWINVQSRLVYYINTIQEAYRQSVKAKDALDIWNDFVSKYLMHIFGKKLFSLKTEKHPYQKDSNSCGVLVCMLGACVAKEDDFMSIKTHSRAILRHREQIWKVLCANKDGDKCVVCRKVENVKNLKKFSGKWTSCESCGNWVHLSCANVCYSLTKEELTQIVYSCSFCSRKHK